MRFPNIWNVRFAIQGIWTALKEETQVFWGLLCALAMGAIALWRGVTETEFSILLVLFGAVLAAEMFNGAIERLCNKVEPNRDSEIKNIKDLASGAVLLISIITLVVWVLFVFF